MDSKKNKKQVKLIFYAPILEYPPAGGPQLSVINAIKVLSNISDLHIITCVAKEKHMSTEIQAFFRKCGCKVNYTPSSLLYFENPNLERALRILRRIFSSLFAIIDSRYIYKYSITNEIDIFWIDRVIEHSFSIFKSIRYKFPDKLVVGDTEAVHSRFILRELPIVKNPLRRLFIKIRGKLAVANEIELVKKADAVTAVSDIDVEYFSTFTDEKSKILKFSNVIDLDDFKDIYEPSVEIEKKSALLLGSFGHPNSPMDRAARWLAQEIMPLVTNEIPNVHLYIIGRNSQITQKSLNSKNITVVGQVKSVVPYLQKAMVTLVPLRFESGTRFKIIESGAASVACVSTTLGAEGLDLVINEDILIADNTKDFADAMIKVLKDDTLALKLGNNLNNCIKNKYSIQSQIIEGKKILNYINKNFNG